MAVERAIVHSLRVVYQAGGMLTCCHALYPDQLICSLFFKLCLITKQSEMLKAGRLLWVGCKTVVLKLVSFGIRLERCHAAR